MDQVNGNDVTGGINGLPFLTVLGAISGNPGSIPNGTAYNGNTGYTIWVMPGKYYGNSGIYIPQNCAIRGLSAQTVTLGLTGATQNTNLITMAPSTRIEDVTLQITTATNNVNVTGIYFPGTSTSSKARVCIVNASSSATGGTGAVYGVYADGQTNLNGQANAYTLQSTNAMQRCTINANSFLPGATGPVRGMYVAPGSTCQMAVRDCVFYAGFTGTTGFAIGVENGSTSSFISLKTSTVFGGTADISQPRFIGGNSGTTGYKPSIQLTATDLVNANSIGGFSVNTSPNQVSYIVTGSFSGVQVKYYLLPGNAVANTIGGTVQGITFAQKTILFAMSAFIYVLPTGTTPSNHTITINLYKTQNFNSIAGVNPFASCVFSIAMVNSQNPIILQNFSASFFPGVDYLFVEVVLFPDSSNVGTLPLIITLSSY